MDFKRLEWLTRMDVPLARKPLELVRTALVRGRRCELIASGSALGDRAGDGFLMGLFSLLDAMMGRPLDALIGDLGLAGAVCTALTAQSAPGDARKTVYDLSLACESADPSRIEPLSGTLGIAGDEMASPYWNALHWPDDVCQAAV